MKKYLMMGIAALALASCSKDEVTYINPDVQKYETAFINRFGQPNSNQTWGFSADATRAMTRGHNADGNMWVYYGYEVPDPLSDGQKARVQYYFQMVQYPGGVKDYGQIDFFVQQVYTGSTDPMAGLSPEVYTSADAALKNQSLDLTGGPHMDKLTAGHENEHIYSFNRGTATPNPNIMNNNSTDVNDRTQQHEDQIMLMVDCYTDCFGFNNSDASYVHQNRYRQVAAAVIDQYIQDNYTAYSAWLAAKAARENKTIDDEAVNDEWGQKGRSFIGFDYDMLPESECYAYENGAVKELTIWGDYYINGELKNNYVYQYDSHSVKMLMEQENRYCGQVHKFLSQDDLYYELRDADNNNAYIGKALNTELINGLLSQGYLPVDNKGLCDWVKVGSCADGYYSDWIVSFMPASEPEIIIDDDPYDLRIMAEDLTVSENSDFDFNDIVFDVKYVNSSQVDIKILAAGGIYPIRINQNSNWEAHAILDASMTMTNTYPGQHYAKTAKEILHVSGSFGSSKSDQAFFDGVKAIKVEVSKNGGQTWTELEAPVGKVASKIAVPVTVDWCDEFQDIDVKWGGSKSSGKFAAWVANPSQKFWE